MQTSTHAHSFLARILGFILLYFPCPAILCLFSLSAKHSSIPIQFLPLCAPSRRHMPPFGRVISNYNDYPCESCASVRVWAVWLYGCMCVWVDGGRTNTHLVCVLVNYLMVCKFADALRRCSVSILRLRKINFATPFVPFYHSIHVLVGKRCVCVMDLCN